MIRNATFTRVWNGGYEVSTDCKVNTETGEVFDIKMAEVDDSFEQLDYEYITLEGEIYLYCIYGKWYARDYREDLGGAFPIETETYINPIITNDEAEDKNIDIIKCCEMCGVYYVE